MKAVYFKMIDLKMNGSGHVLRQMRDEAGVSLRELAEKLDWNQGTLSKYENNQLGLSLEVAEQIADALGCSREELAVRCLQARYNTLAKSTTNVGKLAYNLVEALAKKSKKV